MIFSVVGSNQFILKTITRWIFGFINVFQVLKIEAPVLIENASVNGVERIQAGVKFFQWVQPNLILSDSSVCSDPPLKNELTRVYLRAIGKF